MWCQRISYAILILHHVVLLGNCETPAAARPGSAGSAAGFCVATCYPKSGICKKSPFGSFYDFCPLKLRHGTWVVRLTQNASE